MLASMIAKNYNVKQVIMHINSSNYLKSVKITPNEASNFDISIAKDGIKRSALDILSKKGVNFDKLRLIWKKIPKASKKEEEQIEINAHYSGYMEKQKADIIAFRKDEDLLIPEKINYSEMSGLSNEVKSKFKLIRPKTLGQALRIDGITPAAVYILLSHIKKKLSIYSAFFISFFTSI